MKLVWIVLAMLAWPVAAWLAENRLDDEEKRNINRMADSDRKRQSMKPMNRRMKYVQVKKPALLAQHGRPIKGR